MGSLQMLLFASRAAFSKFPNICCASCAVRHASSYGGTVCLDRNPAQRLQLPSVPDYMMPTFTPEYITAMLDACDLSTWLGYRGYTIILVLLETGIRVSELCRLRLQDVDDDHIRVFEKGREAGISPEASPALVRSRIRSRSNSASASSNEG